jgi:hypothetical protein
LNLPTYLYLGCVSWPRPHMHWAGVTRRDSVFPAKVHGLMIKAWETDTLKIMVRGRVARFLMSDF